MWNTIAYYSVIAALVLFGLLAIGFLFGAIWPMKARTASQRKRAQARRTSIRVAGVAGAIAVAAATTLLTGVVAPEAPAPITLACSLNSAHPRPGMTVTLTYAIQSKQPMQVGLGAGIYDDQRNDSSTGTGDIDSIQLVQGDNTKTRIVPIPKDLPSGTYELTAEVWPPNKIGADGAEILADTPCATFSVPK